MSISIKAHLLGMLAGALAATALLAFAYPGPSRAVEPAAGASSAGAPPPASASSTAAATTAKAAKCDDKNTLGVERVVEIDTTDGPRLGNLQYKDIDFLKPGEVVLTFDDGPSRQTTPQVLEALALHCTRATFFMVGRMAISDPEMVKRVASLGHTIGTHTWSHQNQGALSAKSAEREIELGISAITAALGKPIAPFFRFPYLSDPRRSIAELEKRNQAIFSIDVDSYDWRARSRSVMHNNVLSQLQKRGKGIILFHDIQRVTSSSLVDLLDELKRRKFNVVHIVPKATAVTIAAYDDIVAKEFGRKQGLAAAKPLTTRAMVWPMSEGPATASVQRPAEQEALPWARSTAATEAAAPPRANRKSAARRTTQTGVEGAPEQRSRPWKREEPTWQEQMFQHYQ